MYFTLMALILKKIDNFIEDCTEIIIHKYELKGDELV